MAIRCYSWKAAADIAADFSQLIPGFRSNKELEDWARKYVSHHAGRCRWDADFLTNNFGFSSCLNVGGAPFLLEYLLKKARPELSVVSLDLNPARFPGAERVLDVKIVQLNVEDTDREEVHMLGQFECIIFCEIFEHLRMNILRTVSLLRDLLADDGILYLTTPNGLGLSAIRNKLLRGRTGPAPVFEWSKLGRIGHMGHVREYSLREVCEVLGHCGFMIETYFYRRNSRDWGTVRSKLMNAAREILTRAVPSLGDEIGLVLRKAAHSTPDLAGTLVPMVAQT
jgi:SAM-dependent methyltransferase